MKVMGSNPGHLLNLFYFTMPPCNKSPFQSQNQQTTETFWSSVYDSDAYEFILDVFGHMLE